MLTVTVHLFEDGCLAGFEAAGHAGAEPAGENVACAAATALLRTAGRVLLSEGLVVDGSRDTPGNMSMRVVSRGTVDAGRLSGVTDFLLRGLRDLEAEFPAHVAVVVV